VVEILFLKDNARLFLSGNHWTLSSKGSASCLKKYSPLAVTDAGKSEWIDINVPLHDGMTGLRKFWQIFGDRMAVMGDIPAHLFSLGTPDDLYNYVRDLICDIGPIGSS
jgi:hypothetical protein